MELKLRLLTINIELMENGYYGLIEKLKDGFLDTRTIIGFTLKMAG